MPAVRVYIHYVDEGGDEGLNMTIKIKLPKSWKAGPVSNLKEVRRALRAGPRRVQCGVACSRV